MQLLEVAEDIVHFSYSEVTSGENENGTNGRENAKGEEELGAPSSLSGRRLSMGCVGSTGRERTFSNISSGSSGSAGHVNHPNGPPDSVGSTSIPDCTRRMGKDRRHSRSDSLFDTAISTTAFDGDNSSSDSSDSGNSSDDESEETRKRRKLNIRKNTEIKKEEKRKQLAGTAEEATHAAYAAAAADACRSCIRTQYRSILEKKCARSRTIRMISQYLNTALPRSDRSDKTATSAPAPALSSINAVNLLKDPYLLHNIVVLVLAVCNTTLEPRSTCASAFFRQYEGVADLEGESRASRLRQHYDAMYVYS